MTYQNPGHEGALALLQLQKTIMHFQQREGWQWILPHQNFWANQWNCGPCLQFGQTFTWYIVLLPVDIT
jgi:hypothetical protein